MIKEKFFAAHIVAGDALSYEEGEEFLFNHLVGDQSGSLRE
jgi:hypothetical protein